MTDTQPFSLASLSFVGPGAVREEQLILHEDDRLWLNWPNDFGHLHRAL